MRQAAVRSGLPSWLQVTCVWSPVARRINAQSVWRQEDEENTARSRRPRFPLARRRDPGARSPVRRIRADGFRASRHGSPAGEGQRHSQSGGAEQQQCDAHRGDSSWGQAARGMQAAQYFVFPVPVQGRQALIQVVTETSLHRRTTILSAVPAGVPCFLVDSEAILLSLTPEPAPFHARTAVDNTAVKALPCRSDRRRMAWITVSSR